MISIKQQKPVYLISFFMKKNVFLIEFRAKIRLELVFLTIHLNFQTFQFFVCYCDIEFDNINLISKID